MAIVGVRPQYIKAAALTQIVARHNRTDARKIELSFIDSGQHYSRELSPSFLIEALAFRERVEHTTKDPFGVFLDSISEIGIRIRADDPDGVIVVGDANPTLVGAIVASKLDLPVIHFEAGAKRDPAEQEERNRRVVDSLATLRLCVSQRAVAVLEGEGLPKNNVWTGDLWYDQFMRIASSPLRGRPCVRETVLVTIHRPHNLLTSTLGAISGELAGLGRPVRWVTHPRTHGLVSRLCRGVASIRVEPALSYRDVVCAMCESVYVVTDSGGLIREAHHLGRRVLVRRDIGGWVELMEAGVNRRIGRSSSDIHAGLEWAERHWNDEYPSSSPLRRADGARIALEAILSTVGSRDET